MSDISSANDMRPSCYYRVTLLSLGKLKKDLPILMGMAWFSGILHLNIYSYLLETLLDDSSFWESNTFTLHFLFLWYSSLFPRIFKRFMYVCMYSFVFVCLLYIQCSACMHLCMPEEATRSHYKWLLSHHAVAGNLIQDFSKSGQCS